MKLYPILGTSSSGAVEKRKRVKELSSDDENEQEESKDMKAMGECNKVNYANIIVL